MTEVLARLGRVPVLHDGNSDIKNGLKHCR